MKKIEKQIIKIMNDFEKYEKNEINEKIYLFEEYNDIYIILKLIKNKNSFFFKFVFNKKMLKVPFNKNFLKPYFEWTNIKDILIWFENIKIIFSSLSLDKYGFVKNINIKINKESLLIDEIFWKDLKNEFELNKDKIYNEYYDKISQEKKIDYFNQIEKIKYIKKGILDQYIEFDLFKTYIKNLTDKLYESFISKNDLKFINWKENEFISEGFVNLYEIQNESFFYLKNVFKENEYDCLIYVNDILEEEDSENNDFTTTIVIKPKEIENWVSISFSLDDIKNEKFNKLNFWKNFSNIEEFMFHIYGIDKMIIWTEIWFEKNILLVKTLEQLGFEKNERITWTKKFRGIFSEKDYYIEYDGYFMKLMKYDFETNEKYWTFLEIINIKHLIFIIKLIEWNYFIENKNSNKVLLKNAEKILKVLENSIETKELFWIHLNVRKTLWDKIYESLEDWYLWNCFEIQIWDIFINLYYRMDSFNATKIEFYRIEIRKEIKNIWEFDLYPVLFSSKDERHIYDIQDLMYLVYSFS